MGWLVCKSHPREGVVDLPSLHVAFADVNADNSHGLGFGVRSLFYSQSNSQLTAVVQSAVADVLNIPYEVDITTLPTPSLAAYAKSVSGQWLYFRYKVGERGGIIQDARREDEVEILEPDDMEQTPDDDLEDDESAIVDDDGDEAMEVEDVEDDHDSEDD
jgi:hypothetical protein